MALTRAQAAIWQKARSLGGGGQAVGLDDEACNYLLGRIVLDLGLEASFPRIPKSLPPLFSSACADKLNLTGFDSRELFEGLIAARPDADTYFACLAALHKARLKYERILSSQPMPTLEQVGPRALLQYGKLSSRALRSFLFWRKWFYDIDGRAGQETGYLFEPVIAYAIGGTPAPATKSPVKRHRDRNKGRQVDCIIEKRAYEIKIRVTIAASGQGRWQEELDFPIDCQRSGFIPVLVCLDATQDEKLDALAAAFRREGGETYIGDDAWSHLEASAGPTMTIFLERYVRGPLQAMLREAGGELLELRALSREGRIEIALGDEVLQIDRAPEDADQNGPDAMPDDADDIIPGA
jgi:hypothetical protein